MRYTSVHGFCLFKLFPIGCIYRVKTRGCLHRYLDTTCIMRYPVTHSGLQTGHKAQAPMHVFLLHLHSKNSNVTVCKR